MIDTHVLDKDHPGSRDLLFVLEIGPGSDNDTVSCTGGKRSGTVEIDKALIPILQDTLSGFPNAEVIQDDILKVDIAELAAERNGGRPIKVEICLITLLLRSL